MKNLLEDLLEEHGMTDIGFRSELSRNHEFQMKLSALKHETHRMHDWVTSHMSMNKRDQDKHIEAEKVKLNHARVDVVASLRSLWSSRQKVEIKLEATEHLRNVPIREVFAMAERGELGTQVEN